MLEHGFLGKLFIDLTVKCILTLFHGESQENSQGTREAPPLVLLLDGGHLKEQEGRGGREGKGGRRDVGFLLMKTLRSLTHPMSINFPKETSLFSPSMFPPFFLFIFLLFNYLFTFSGGHVSK